MFRRLDFRSLAKLCTDGEVNELSNVLFKKPKLVEEKSETRATLLHVACHQGRLDISILLLLKGANIDCTDANGFTPLMVCIQFKRYDCAKMLISRGANVNLANIHNQTALHIASIFGSSELIVPLLDNGAHIDAVDKDGCTAVMLAAGRCHDSIVATLVNCDCNLLNEDKHYNSALSLAKENGLQIATLNSIIFHRELQVVELRARQAKESRKTTPGDVKSEKKGTSKNVNFEGIDHESDGHDHKIRRRSQKSDEKKPDGEDQVTASIKKEKKTKKTKKSKKMKTIKATEEAGAAVGVEEDEPDGGMRVQGEVQRMEESDKKESEMTKDGGEKPFDTASAEDGKASLNDGMHPLHGSEGRLASIMMEINNKSVSKAELISPSTLPSDAPQSSERTNDAEENTKGANEAMTSLAALEMEKRLQLLGLRDRDILSPLPGDETTPDDNGTETKQRVSGGGLAPDFEGSAVSSLTMNSLATEALKKKRSRELEIARRNGHLATPQTNAICWNAVNCMEDQSIGRMQTPMDLWLLSKAEEAKGGSARAKYLRDLALQMEEENKQKKAAAAAAAAASSEAEQKNQTQRLRESVQSSSDSLDYLWCFGSLLEEPKKKSAICDDDVQRQTDHDHSASRLESKSDSLTNKNTDGRRNDKATEGGEKGNPGGYEIEGADDVGMGDSDDQKGLPVNLGEWVPIDTSRKIDPNRPVSKAEMLRMKKRRKKKEQKQAIVSKVMCTEVSPLDRNIDSSKDDYLIRAKANLDETSTKSDDSCKIS